MFASIVWTLVPLLTVGLVFYGIVRLFRRHRETNTLQRSDWHLQVSLDGTDSLSKLFLTLAVFFLLVTLLAFNRDTASPFAINTVVLVASIVGIATAYGAHATYALPFSIVGIIAWWLVEARNLIEQAEGKGVAMLSFMVLVSLLLYVVGALHSQVRPMLRLSLIYKVLGLVSVTVILFVLSSQPGLSMFSTLLKGSSVLNLWFITISLILLAIALITTSVYTVSKRSLSIYELVFVLIIAALAASLVFMPTLSIMSKESAYDLFDFYGTQQLTSDGVVWAAIFNACVFIELVGMIFIGYFRKESWYVNYGAIFLFIFIAIKYFDWFFQFLDKSVFFITAGILLLILGWGMEKGRRYVIKASNLSTPAV